MTDISRAVAALSANLGNLSERDRDFAASLVSQFNARGLSEKQEIWIGKLLDRATGRPPAPAATGLDFAPILRMFASAKSAGLKRPKIEMAVGSDRLTLKLAPETGRNPGCIYVMSQGEYAGKVTPAGDYMGNTAIVGSLRRLADNPIGTARESGHITGACMFCNRRLDDPRSVEVGYGPICAEKYGLSHGANEGAPVPKRRSLRVSGATEAA